MGFKKVCVLIVGFTVLFVNYRIEKFNRTYLKELEGFKDEVDMMVVKDGYKCEIYEVITDDGYILKLHRVMSKKGGRILKKHPVFLMHGLFGSSVTYVLNGPDNAIAYNLVDNGYDVWMGNSRETRNTIGPVSKSHWNFSIDQIGIYDYPALIDGILKLTNKSKLFFIGVSQAANCLLILLSSIPEYNEKIVQAHTLAPFVFMSTFSHQRTLLKTGLKILDLATVHLQHSRMKLTPLYAVFCPIESTSSMNFVCKTMLNNYLTINVATEVKILAAHFKHTDPVFCYKQIQHYLQLQLSGKFRRFDYGEDNLRIYNTSNPPDYQLSNVKVPLYIYLADEDYLAVPKDTEILKNVLSNIIKEYRVIPNYGHSDLIYGNNSKSVLHGDIIKFMNDYV